MPFYVTLSTLHTVLAKIPKMIALLATAALLGFLIYSTRGWLLGVLILLCLFSLDIKSFLTFWGGLIILAGLDGYIYMTIPGVRATGHWQSLVLEPMQAWWHSLLHFFPLDAMFIISVLLAGGGWVLWRPLHRISLLARLNNRWLEPFLFTSGQWAFYLCPQIRFFLTQGISFFLLWFLAFQLLGFPAAPSVAAFSGLAMLMPHFGFWIALIPPVLVSASGLSPFWHITGLAIAGAVIWLIQYLVFDDMDPHIIHWHPVLEIVAIIAGFLFAGLHGIIAFVPLLTLSRVLMDPVFLAIHYYSSRPF